MTSPSLPLRPNVASLEPYASARSILKGDDWIFLDANEGAFPATLQLDELPPLNRYPDPTADTLRDALATFYGIHRNNIVVGNGSDEIIDLCIRSFVRSGRSVLAMQPSYDMYRVGADTSGVPFATVPLDGDFRLDPEATLRAGENADLLFLCSPNNPTGTTIDRSTIDSIVRGFPGIVVIDEAYGEFADAQGIPSAIDLVRDGMKNLIVLRTFSKAFGAAAIRVGYGIASPSLIDILLKMKLPYNVNALSQIAALALWKDRPAMEHHVQQILNERGRLMSGVGRLGCRVFPTYANFFLIQLPKVVSSEEIYVTLRDRYRIVLRKCNGPEQSQNVLRISIGTPEQNVFLLSALSSLLQ